MEPEKRSTPERASKKRALSLLSQEAAQRWKNKSPKPSPTKAKAHSEKKKQPTLLSLWNSPLPSPNPKARSLPSSPFDGVSDPLILNHHFIRPFSHTCSPEKNSDIDVPTENGKDDQPTFPLTVPSPISFTISSPTISTAALSSPLSSPFTSKSPPTLSSTLSSLTISSAPATPSTSRSSLEVFPNEILSPPHTPDPIRTRSNLSVRPLPPFSLSPTPLSAPTPTSPKPLHKSYRPPLSPQANLTQTSHYSTSDFPVNQPPPTDPVSTVDSDFATQPTPLPKLTPQEVNTLSQMEMDNTKLPNTFNFRFYVGEDKRLCVRVRPKDIPSPVAQILEVIPKSNYDNENGVWIFPLKETDLVMSKLKEFSESQTKTELKVYPIPPKIVEIILNKETLTDPTKLHDLSSVPSHLIKSMFPFQVQGLRQGISMNGKVLIADEMGLGKTLQAIGLATYYRKEWPLLVITPSSVRYNWVKELEKWGLVTESEINVIVSGKVEGNLKAPVTIISYDLLPRLATSLKKAAFKVIIADESHYLKTRSAMRTKAAVPLLKKARRTILLSGTPALSRPIELYEQLQAIGWGSKTGLSSFQKFGFRYCSAFRGPFGWDYSGNSNLPELHQLLDSTSLIRRLKKDVLHQLPSKSRALLHIQALPAHTKEINVRIIEAFKMGKHINPTRYKEMIAILFVLTAKAKINGIKEYLRERVKKGDKFLVFAHHQIVLDAIQEVIKETGTNYIRIDGCTPSPQRQTFVNTFQTDENCRVAILSITAAGQGITLSAATHAVFAELYWTPGVLIQAEDRIHRIGQTFPVTIHYLYCEETLDRIMWGSLSRKLEVLGHTFDGKSNDNSLTSSPDPSPSPPLNDCDIPDHVLSSLNFEDLASSSTKT